MTEYMKQHPEKYPPKIDYSNDPNFILNPKTGKYVKKSGPIGKKLLTEQNA
jgi:hypothetical protein